MSTTVASDKTIYMDHAAATPIDLEVLSAMMPYFGPEYGNPSSMYASGRRAGQAIREARSEVAKVLNASLDEIFFAGSGTESDNMALIGTARANRTYGNHIIISAIEHKAVLESALKLRAEGFEVTFLPVDAYGRIDTERCMSLVTEKTILVSVMYANNEIGTIEPIEELAHAIKKYRGSKTVPLFHTDACQAAGHLSLDTKSLGIDLMTLNGSKIYGPKGIGLLYKRAGVHLSPLIVGGEQEMRLRAGTESIPLVVGFSLALSKADAMRKTESARLTVLRNYFMQRIRETIPDAILNGHPTQRLPNNVHVSIPCIEGESILLMLDKYGIEASTGSACSAFDLKPSHVLLAIGQSAEFAHGSIRFSLGRNTTTHEIDQVVSILARIVGELKKISALTAHL